MRSCRSVLSDYACLEVFVFMDSKNREENQNIGDPRRLYHFSRSHLTSFYPIRTWWLRKKIAPCLFLYFSLLVKLIEEKPNMFHIYQPRPVLALLLPKKILQTIPSLSALVPVVNQIVLPHCYFTLILKYCHPLSLWVTIFQCIF